MTWLLILGGFKRILSTIVDWITHASFWQLVSLGLAILAIIQHFQTIEARHDAAKWQRQFNSEHNVRLADHQAYAKAQADAAARNLATVAADKAERERITHDISQSYETELASLRADLARRLRSQAPEGAPGKPGLPGVSAAPGGPDGSPRVSIPSSLYVRGAELELQLERLQGWINEQVKVDPNK